MCFCGEKGTKRNYKLDISNLKIAGKICNFFLRKLKINFFLIEQTFFQLKFLFDLSKFF